MKIKESDDIHGIILIIIGLITGQDIEGYRDDDI